MSLTSTKYTMTKAVGPLTVVTAQVHPMSVSLELPTFDDCFNPLTVSHAYVAQNPMAIGALMLRLVFVYTFYLKNQINTL